mmetsp:Transcript_95411/g.309170  ORF Transcript_95411/g.309170 Transcript_95411/m.309170 type:complete len:189 (-) Transcript_95411:441-1007(-)
MGPRRRPWLKHRRKCAKRRRSHLSSVVANHHCKSCRLLSSGLESACVRDRRVDCWSPQTASPKHLPAKCHWAGHVLFFLLLTHHLLASLVSSLPPTCNRRQSIQRRRHFLAAMIQPRLFSAVIHYVRYTAGAGPLIETQDSRREPLQVLCPGRRRSSRRLLGPTRSYVNMHWSTESEFGAWCMGRTWQ